MLLFYALLTTNHIPRQVSILTPLLESDWAIAWAFDLNPYCGVVLSVMGPHVN